MNIKNCPYCNKVFLENASGMCPDCYKLEQQEELKINDFLHNVETKVNIYMIQEATGAKMRTILKLLHAGRLYQNGILIEYPCQSCGSLITEGRVCRQCSDNIANQQQSTISQPKKERAVRYYSK